MPGRLGIRPYCIISLGHCQLRATGQKSHQLGGQRKKLLEQDQSCNEFLRVNVFLTQRKTASLTLNALEEPSKIRRAFEKLDNRWTGHWTLDNKNWTPKQTFFKFVFVTKILKKYFFQTSRWVVPSEPY